MPEPDLLLDTDVFIEILRGKPQAATWLTTYADQIIGIPVLVRMELVQGVRNKQELQTLIRELGRYMVLHLEMGDSTRALDWFETYHLSHNVGMLDSLIAAIAIRLSKPLYTFNLKHYQIIPGLDVRSPYSR